MTDFTEIALSGTLPDIVLVGQESIVLTDNNKYLKNAISILLIGAAIFLLYKHWVKVDDNQYSI